MYLDKVLSNADYFNPFYEFCQERTKAEQYPWTQELEFVQMVRVLNPQVFGPCARNFFPGYCQDDDERVHHLYVNMNQFRRHLPNATSLSLEGAAIRGKLNKGSFDLAYIYVVRDLQWPLWGKFVESLQGQKIGAQSGHNVWQERRDFTAQLDSLQLKAISAPAPNYALTGEEQRLRLAQRTSMQLMEGVPELSSKPLNPFERLDPYAGLNKAPDIRNIKALQASIAQPVHEVKHGVKHAPVMHRQNAAQQASTVAAALVLPTMAAVQAALSAQSQPSVSRPRGQVVLGQAPGAPPVNGRRLLGKLKVDDRKK